MRVASEIAFTVDPADYTDYQTMFTELGTEITKYMNHSRMGGIIDSVQTTCFDRRVTSITVVIKQHATL